jgi:4-aminobutyrate aminotransferase
VIVFAGSFHGRTHLAMAMTTSKTSYRAGHAPLPAGVYVAPFPDPLAEDAEMAADQALDGLKHVLKTMTAPDETAAVIIEPVLGEGGYVPAPARFLRGVAEVCQENDIPFIADEVQTGCGRTGKMFAVEHFGIEPDIICIAKGIASGFPFAALGMTEELSARWPTGSHGGTYGGNALGCAAALATIDVLTEPGFLDNVNVRGEQLMRGLGELLKDDPGVAQVRGLGLMVGTEFNDPARVAALQSRCLSEGRLILMNAGTYGRTLRWMPPLVVNEREIDLALAAFGGAVKVTT